jgi:hypothetical protein
LGFAALALTTTGGQNTACGSGALGGNQTGNNNIGVGFQAGKTLSTGSNNIYIGADAATGAENNCIRIGNPTGPGITTCIAGIYNNVQTTQAVYIDANGHLGTKVSSQRFKQNIKTMGDASDVLLALRPVSFQYKPEFDPTGSPQFGLIAEEVEKVSPDLVIHEKDGSPHGVRYDEVNAMLLNEFLKEHKRVEEQGMTIAAQGRTNADQAKALATLQKDFETTVAQQQREIKDLTASLKEQAVLLQKVSAEVQLARPALRVVSNNR